MALRVTVERAIAALNEAMLDDACWAHASRLIDQACGTRGSLLTFGAELESGDVQFYFAKCFFHGECREDWWQEWLCRYYLSDEQLPRMRRLPDSKIAHVTDLLTEEELRMSRSYNEGMPRFRMQNGLRVRLDGPRGSRIVWALADPVDADGWSSSRLGTIAAVLEPLRQYVRVRSALVEAEAFGASVIEMLGSSRLGVIQLDRRGRIVEANDVASKLLRRAEGLSDADGMLRAVQQKENARLAHLLNNALATPVGRGASGSLSVSNGPNNLPMSLHLAPVSNRDDRFPGGKVAALALIADPLSQARIEPGVVAEVLGLTSSEAQIAVSLAEGRTPREIAEDTGRTYSTVRTHLKHVFSKLGVTRQIDLARAVLALSSPSRRGSTPEPGAPRRIPAETRARPASAARAPRR